MPAPPWCTTAATRPNSACWLTSPTAKQSSWSSIRARSAQPRARRTRRPCARIASMATRAMSCGARMLPKPTYTGGGPASRNASSSGRERAFVGQDPRAGLHHVEVGRLLPGGQDRVRRQPRLVAEDVVADVVHRRQADRRPVGVERLAVHRVIALGVQLPQHPVVGHVRWEWPARQRVRPVVRRRQEDRAVAHVHGVDAQFLGHRQRAGRGRYHAAGHQRVASLGGRGDLVRTTRRSTRPRAWARRPATAASPRAPARAPARRPAPAARRPRPAAPRTVRRRAHQRLRAEFPQPHRECHQRFDVPARFIRRQQHTHFASPIP